MSDLQKLSPFKYFVLTNFPFIEADFDALTNYELMCEVTKYINQIADRQNETIDAFNSLEVDFTELETSMATYRTMIDYKIAQFQAWFDNLDVQDEINTKLDQMAQDGTLSDLVEPFIPSVVTAWLNEHITQPTTPVVDSSLTISGAAADAQVTGNRINDVNTALDEIIKSLFISEEININTWQQGTLKTEDGTEASTTARCRTRFLEFTDLVRLTIADGYKVGVRVYNSASTASYLDHYPFKEKELIIYPDGKFYRFIIAKTDDGKLLVDDIPENVLTGYDYQYTDRTLTLNGKAADAKVTGDNITLLTDAIKNNAQVKITPITSWRNGTINGTTGVISTGFQNRCYTTNKFEFPDAIFSKVKINVEAGYAVGTRFYNKNDDAYMGGTAFAENSYDLELNKNYYYRFLIKKTDDSNFVYTSLSDSTVAAEMLVNDPNTSIITRNDPVSMLVKLQQLNRKTRTGSNTFGNKPLCLLHFSDIHGDKLCLQNVVDFYNEYSGYIDNIIHTGDTVLYTSEDGTNFWQNVLGSENILNVIGNHDTRIVEGDSYNWIGLSMAESYAAYMLPYIANWDVNYTANKTYYYKDYANEQVRIIALDIMHQSEDQLTWFESTLTDALANNLDVLVIVHSRAHWELESYESSWDDKINSPSYQAGFTDTSNYSGTNYPSNLSNSYASAVDNFISDGGNFICWLHGHTHYRMTAKLETHSDQLDFAVANASGSDYARTYVWEKVLNTKSMDDFNIIAIDTTAKIFRAVKVGVDCDRYMRIARTFSYDYKNKIVIYAD